VSDALPTSRNEHIAQRAALLMVRRGQVLLGLVTAGKSTSTSGVHRVRCNVGATTSSLQLSLQLISIDHRICVASPACHHPSDMATSEQARHSVPPSGWSPPKFVQSRQVLPDREASTYGDRCILT
jgi:hypothetical protein